MKNKFCEAGYRTAINIRTNEHDVFLGSQQKDFYFSSGCVTHFCGIKKSACSFRMASKALWVRGHSCVALLY